MRTVEIVCVQCPMGCKLKIIMDEENKISDISGYTCERGKQYAVQEITDPKRIIPSSIKVVNGELPLVSVKTDRPVSKKLISEIMIIIKKSSVTAPVKVGQVLVKNILGTGADIVATRQVNAK
jgi:CxxC motif-containing protein